MKMPFGKHKGEELENLPQDYIKWILANLSLDDDLVRELENQLELKQGHGVPRKL